MSRNIFKLLPLALLGLIFVLPTASAAAADGDAPPPKENAGEKPAAAASLPLTKVALFSSGVGFFEHDGEVTGDAHVDLQFKVHDIDDLLKSMVLQDFSGGRISTVNYGSKEPVTKTLESFSIDLNGQPTMADLLRQLRGESVEVDAPQPVTGTIIGVEKRKLRSGKDETVEVEFLNLLTSEGLRSISLENVVRIKLNNAKLNNELQQALAVLATAHDTDKKTVTLHFLGNGKRQVRVGYVQEAPLWRTSYRLVLKDKAEPFLQGWAIVENPTEQDWKDVSLTLISGRPISFVMDLYDPLYLTRPTVVPQLYASLRPQTYDQDLANRERMFHGAEDKAKADEMADAEGAGSFGGMAMRKAARAPMGAAVAGSRPQNGAFAYRRQLDLQQGGQSLAEAAKVGELFRYTIETPVTLARRQSAMLPIVNESIKGKKVSIYNAQVQAKYPLNGLQLTNSTALHLMQGPITVFDGGNYAGDAEIDDVQPGAERLISYAMDLDTEVAPESIGHPEQLVSVRIAKGTLYASRKYTRTMKYTVKNSGAHDKDVLIEYPIDPSWKLIAPEKPTEKTRDLYRFSVNAEPGKPAVLSVEEERTDQQSWAVTNLDNGTILFYARSQATTPKVKDSLEEVIKRKEAIEQLAQKRQQLEQQVRVIDADQARIRQNMHELDHTLKIYSDYVEKFSKQESQIDALHKQIESLQNDENGARKSLDDYLLSLDLS
ncbi:MAG TPA: hypothetical protein VHX65_03095 [Pirellulales bacterium]|jgi:hypothetical protein|nr:hypothetical protein [Pirellulales bacterium]